MPLEYVKLFNFRNFYKTETTFNKGLNVFFGRNGQGKTNLTEALLLVTRGKSFRKSKREELIRYGEKEAIIETAIDKNRIKIHIDKHNKRTLLNNKLLYRKQQLINCYFINSDLLFYFKNFSQFRIKLIDKLCYNVFGSEFLIYYKKYLKAAKNLRSETYNKIWLDLLKKYKNEVNCYRTEFFKKIKEEYNNVKETIELDDCIISFKGEEKRELNILRKDRKDLSLGELKSVLFSIIYSTIKIEEKGEKILIFDDFNSEWDYNRQKRIKNLINDLKIQSFIMQTEQRDDSNFIIQKGEIQSI
ncbi:MAG: DNA replication/repair protein RecF [bacterium]